MHMFCSIAKEKYLEHDEVMFSLGIKFPVVQLHSIVISVTENVFLENVGLMEGKLVISTNGRNPVSVKRCVRSLLHSR